MCRQLLRTPILVNFDEAPKPLSLVWRSSSEYRQLSLLANEHFCESVQIVYSPHETGVAKTERIVSYLASFLKI